MLLSCSKCLCSDIYSDGYANASGIYSDVYAVTKIEIRCCHIIMIVKGPSSNIQYHKWEISSSKVEPPVKYGVSTQAGDNYVLYTFDTISALYHVKYHVKPFEELIPNHCMIFYRRRCIFDTYEEAIESTEDTSSGKKKCNPLYLYNACIFCANKRCGAFIHPSNNKCGICADCLAFARNPGPDIGYAIDGASMYKTRGEHWNGSEIVKNTYRYVHYLIRRTIYIGDFLRIDHKRICDISEGLSMCNFCGITLVYFYPLCATCGQARANIARECAYKLCLARLVTASTKLVIPAEIYALIIEWVGKVLLYGNYL